METEGETHTGGHVITRQTLERCSHKPRTPRTTRSHCWKRQEDRALEGVQPCNTLILDFWLADWRSRFLLFQATWLVVLCMAAPGN